MKVSIGIHDGVYLPEAYAYREFLAGRGYSVLLAADEELYEIDCDVAILFMGLAPFWAGKTRAGVTIHEYHSLSIPPLPHAKDWLKSKINAVPAGRIFLNEIVRNRLSLPKASVPCIFRDMGVDRTFFEVSAFGEKEFDLVYVGKMQGRPGLLPELSRLSAMGFRILLVGDPGRAWKDIRAIRNAEVTGRLPPSKVATQISRARAGLNFIPDMYPFNIQTSTKFIEYCAAGIPIVSNRYSWVEGFVEKRGGRVLWLDQICSPNCLLSFPFVAPSVDDLEWSQLLEGCGFEPFIRSLVA